MNWRTIFSLSGEPFTCRRKMRERSFVLLDGPN
jgi:hypothetical protein